MPMLEQNNNICMQNEKFRDVFFYEEYTNVGFSFHFFRSVGQNTETKVSNLKLCGFKQSFQK